MDAHRNATATTGTPPVATARQSTPAGTPAGARRPRRVLVVSADMGGGHNATAAALEESVARVWPGAEFRRIDALDVMGGWVGDAFRRTYITNVELTPWLYEFFYASLWRHRWFAAASKRFVGTWCGRRLIRHIDAFDPDLVLSTYPLGTAGLDWLIRHRALSVPVASWVSDMAPHPFWVYPNVAMNYLVHAAAVPAARCAEPRGRYRVSALPVTSRFTAGDRRSAREALGLRPDAVVAMVSCGSYAFGDVTALVRTVAEVSDRIQVVAVCGRNEDMRHRLDALGFGRDRVLPLGWSDQMSAVTAAADLVIGNAGGATALEALACGVPLVLTEPIAAHGAANADLMAVAGTAQLCTDRAALAAYLRTVVRRHAVPANGVDFPAARNGGGPTLLSTPVSDPAARSGPAPAAGTSALDADVAAAARLANAGRARRYAGWPMRPSDAFFRHVETTGAAQELGVVLQLGRRADGSTPPLADIRAALQQRTTLPSLRRILLPSHPGWRLAGTADAAEHVDEVVLATGDPAACWDAAGDLFGERLPAGRPAWRMRLVRGTGETVLFAIKMHHSQGDGISALGLLDRLLDPADDDPLPERRPLPGRPEARVGPVGIARGLVALAGRGFAARHPLGEGRLSTGRMLVGGSLPWRAVRTLAGRSRASVTETAIALGAHALQRMLPRTGLLDPSAPLRTMVPVAMRPARLDREFGNWTGSLAADLDMAEMSLPDRVDQVRDELRRRQRDREAPAAAAVMGLAGRLPVPLHRAFTRAVYDRRFFSTVVSFMPGARRDRWLAGAPVTRMAPVLPLPPRVPVTLGMIVTAGRLDIGITVDRRLALSRREIDAALADLVAEAER